MLSIWLLILISLYLRKILNNIITFITNQIWLPQIFTDFPAIISAWILDRSNLCRGRPPPRFSLVKDCLPTLAKMLTTDHAEKNVAIFNNEYIIRKMVSLSFCWIFAGRIVIFPSKKKHTRRLYQVSEVWLSLFPIKLFFANSSNINDSNNVILNDDNDNLLLYVM